MIAEPFALEVPEGLDHALDLLARHGDSAHPLAGGTVLLPEIGRGAVRPGVVIALARCGLEGVTERGDALVVGACTTYRELSTRPGLLGTFARGVTGGAQLRNRATIGGSAAWANPSSDAPAVLVALEAMVVLASSGGARRVAAADFFIDAFRTAARPAEMLIGIELPARPRGRHGYSKLKFGESSWPIVTAAAVVRSDGSARVAVGGATAAPFAVEVDAAAELEEAVRARLTEPWSDVLADGGYRRRVAPVVARRAMEAAA